MVKAHLKENAGTLVSVALIGYASYPYGAGFFLLVSLIFAVPLNYLYFKFNKISKESIFKKLSIWAFLIIFLSAKHTYVHYETRNDANAFAERVLAKKLESGSYPEKVEFFMSKNAGVKIAYIPDPENPVLYYPTEFSSFEGYIYSFSKQKWTVAHD